MIRQGRWKLNLFAPQNDTVAAWGPQLFDMQTDPWEHTNVASRHPQTVAELSKLLAMEVDVLQADRMKKAFDKYMFKTYRYDKNDGSKGCESALSRVYAGFDPGRDAAKITEWLGQPCH